MRTHLDVNCSLPAPWAVELLLAHLKLRVPLYSVLYELLVARVDVVNLFLVVKILDYVVQLVDYVGLLDHDPALRDYLKGLGHYEVEVCVRLNEPHDLLNSLRVFWLGDDLNGVAVNILD